VVEGDYYELLGVPKSADERTIKAAFRKAAMDCHPDRHGGCTDKEAHFKALNEAYDVLKDPQKRAAYDRFGKAAFQNGGGGEGNPFGAGGGFEGFSDIFSSIFGEFMDPRGQQQNVARGADLRYDLELTLEEAFAGTSKTITVEALAECEPCHGKGSRGEARPQRCATCGGAGKVRAQQGFFVVERGCPTCMGSGETIADPCPACDGEGRALGVFCGRKLLQAPAGVGTCRVGEAVWDSAAVEGALRLLRELGFHGISQVEYKRDPRDGSLRLMEVNARLWQWHSLASDCGVDLVEIAYRDVLGLPVPEATSERAGQRRWVALVRHLRESRRDRLGLRKTLAPLRPPFSEPVLSLRDPMPGVHQVYGALRGGGR